MNRRVFWCYSVPAMIYDSLTLAACIDEMRSALCGLIVHQVRQPNDLEIVLMCRAGGRHAEALLSADARFARAHLNSVREKVPQTPPGFCQSLRKNLEGTRLASIDQIGIDRVMRLTFQSADGRSLYLMHEIMGRHSNIVLVSSDEKIISVIKPVSARVSRTRQLLPGRDYVLPPVERASPVEIGESGFRSLWKQTFPEDAPTPEAVQRWLVSSFGGISPFLAREITARSAATTAEDLYATLSGILDVLQTRHFQPVIIRDPGGTAELVYPLPVVHLPSEWQHPRPRISEALESAVRAEMLSSALESTRTEILRQIARAADSVRQERAEMEAVLADTGAEEELRRRGETLAGNFHAIPSGADLVELPDYYDPEMKPISINLRPELSVQENTERYFRLARKAKDRLVAAQRRLPEISRALETLTEAEDQVRQATNRKEILERRSALENARLLRQPQQLPLEKAERPFGGYRIRTRTSSDGIEILLGETAEANDYLTTRVARPNDIWLHARSVTGAHVIVRTAGIRQIPQSTLQEAAAIAAENSDARHSSYVPVDWTYRKYVRKPRGSATGLVTYSHEKTIHITRGSRPQTRRP